MAKQREGVYERIIECARKEFLEKGYMDASLRTIATQAGTTTGSIYTRFKDIPQDRLSVSVAGSFTDPDAADSWRQQVQTAFPEFEIKYYPLSASICCHVGANAVGIAVSVIE